MRASCTPNGEALGSWTQEPGAVASMALRQKSIGRKALTPIWTEAVNACSFKGADGIAFWRTLTCTSANELGVRIWVFVCMPTARALVHRVRTSAELSDGSCPVRLCVPFAVEVGQMTVSEELMTELQKTRNGKKLAAALEGQTYWSASKKCGVRRERATSLRRDGIPIRIDRLEW